MTERSEGTVGLTVGLCGCGRPVRYMTPSGDACNKYMRCLTYDELGQALAQANALLLAYRAKRAVDGLNGRTWDAAEHMKAEAQIEALEQRHNDEVKPRQHGARETAPTRSVGLNGLLGVMPEGD